MNLYHHVYYKLWEMLQDICPAGQGNPSDCPVSFLRKMNPAQRLQWFAAQDDYHVILQLAAYHQNCRHGRPRSKPIVAVATRPRSLTEIGPNAVPAEPQTATTNLGQLRTSTITRRGVEAYPHGGLND